MNVTDIRAGSKWCPFTRVANYFGTETLVVNRTDSGAAVPSSGCLGSGCMAWRWNFVENVEVSRAGKPNSERVGYCGIAGRPDR